MMKIEVTASELKAGASKIDDANNDVREAANALKQATETLAGMWEGPSKEAFVQEQAQIDAWYQQMINVVTQYAQSMKDAADAYTQTDQDAAANIRAH